MHKHDKEIRAWLDGKTVQIKLPSGHWGDLSSVEQSQMTPVFYVNEEYRIKPEVVKYRPYLWKSYTSLYYVSVVHTHNAAETMERDSPSFIRWLGDWQEAEV